MVVDLGDGACQKYRRRLEVIEEVDANVSDMDRVLNSVPTLQEILCDICKDLLFIHDRKCCCNNVVLALIIHVPYHNTLQVALH